MSTLTFETLKIKKEKKLVVEGEREQGREGKEWEWGGNWNRVKERDGRARKERGMRGKLGGWGE